MTFVITQRGERMQECPYCSYNLNGLTRRKITRTNEDPGGKSTGNELVTCPDCDGVIDGFTSH